MLPFCLLRSQDNSGQSPIDPALASKITVEGFCLCRTTLSDLKNLQKNFNEVEVEEMDEGKRCFAQDSRYIHGKGYYSESYPGMIFQKDRDEDYISKIRLTKGFKGRLPDGAAIDMDKLLLKDVIKLYPALNNTWGSRDCSDFWTFSNDTVAFYVRIDKSKQPLYPIDEAYYLNKPIEGIDILISCYSVYHRSNEFSLFPADEPAFFLDSIRVNSGVLKSYSPSEIAFISVYKDSNAIRLAGKDGVNGAVYIITKSFAREHYWKYFQSRSAEYRKLAPDLKSEFRLVYVLNDKTLTKDQEADLFEINDSNFLKLKISGKRVIIKSQPPR
ncbi:MAG: hypothetical protein BGO55_21665 [Sphingobacteriales bacterium 50-39]|nr:MAG: hypothetical protein BGO55_21665 [Sphingobacteriales bacterium 50-39]